MSEKLAERITKLRRTPRDMTGSQYCNSTLAFTPELSGMMSQDVSLRWWLQKTRMFLRSFNSSRNRTNSPSCGCFGEISSGHEVILQDRTLQKAYCLQDSGQYGLVTQFSFWLPSWQNSADDPRIPSHDSLLTLHFGPGVPLVRHQMFNLMRFAVPRTVLQSKPLVWLIEWWTPRFFFYFWRAHS